MVPKQTHINRAACSEQAPNSLPQTPATVLRLIQNNMHPPHPIPTQHNKKNRNATGYK